ncbi:4'-phosphopantetheinyl transferase superfamily protein [Mangrovivirga sp. M17]|uniref:Enterobactin synthase component D n=1 Tax=Mangrovivirga halotolerans TaxID=2993936 RepID=A0ABT3RT67_9BACT|nr:4'-phosphopantetheinyl transferase superfamily protein [Mangrovivirga halotolerans]MCX2744992.1 4'-phosphopantetheinyl transferase superfamily protein [Mangrovivirga halotolerans]
MSDTNVKNIGKNSFLFIRLLDDLNSNDHESVNSSNDQIILSSLKTTQRKREWLTIRNLLFEACSKFDIKYSPVIKDEYGKPHLPGFKGGISYTHSKTQAGLLIHPHASVGIDIEKPREQLYRVENKFLTSEEKNIYCENLELMTLAWSAKESIYKAYGRKSLSLKDDIDLIRIDYNKGIITARIVKGKMSELMKVHFFFSNDEIVTYTIREKADPF